MSYTIVSQQIEVLYDDHPGIAPGEKFADSDLIGCPYRLVVSEKTLKQNQKIEFKSRVNQKIKLLSLAGIVKKLKNNLK